ncbi:hypothetical protein AHAS_Ahas02G0135900 [Arachis hypogaea]
MIGNQSPRAWWMFCIRHIGSNFNIGYSMTVEEYNIKYKRLQERGEAYARWSDASRLRNWVLAFDERHR